MPFTFSHPAIILPLAKINSKRISATGLIIGSMAPDFEFFIRMRLQKVHGHTFEGIFYWDLPLTIVLAFIFHLFVRDPLINHSPTPIKSNFSGFVGLNWTHWFSKYWYVFLYSALIGIFSHLFWDGFTHASGFFGYQPFPLLLQEVQFFFWKVPIHVIAQMVSTLLGGVVILVVLVFPKQKTYVQEDWKKMFSYWIIVALVALAVMILRDIQSVGDLIATSISGIMIGMIGTPLIMKNMKRYAAKKILDNEKNQKL